ncbi:MAG TPA: hypothetical protein VHZ55_21075 [Bryobacteraceae bacterium]|jgi:hypothetical protein|nr:hypothetical protein [Bryobacteraceae bacterium]
MSNETAYGMLATLIISISSTFMRTTNGATRSESRTHQSSDIALLHALRLWFFRERTRNSNECEIRPQSGLEHGGEVIGDLANGFVLPKQRKGRERD